MRKFLISAVLASAAIAAPASAQYWDRDRYDHRDDYRAGDVGRQLDQLSERIDRAYERRLISRNEAQRLSNQLRNIGRLYQDYRRGGISPREHQILQRRIEDLRQRIQWERREGRNERRYDRRW